MVSFVGVLGFLVGAVGASMTLLNPVNRYVTYTSNLVWPNALPDPTTAIELRWKRKMTEEDYLTIMRSYGFNEEVAKWLYWNAERVLNIGQAIDLYRRGIIDEQTLYDIAQKQGIDKSQVGLWVEAYAYYPSPSDLIRFAVRDVWKEEIVRRFGYDEEFPEKFAEEAQKVGMSPEWAKMYWRAHWELPSLTLAFEAFHRLNPEFEKETPVTQDDIMDLMKLHDILPYWRPRILKLSYNLPTRVDVRRFVRYGFISSEEAYKIYRQMGYTEEHAKWLVQLALYEKNLEEIDLTKTMIRDAYLSGLMSKDEAKEALMKLGFSEKEADLAISLWLHDAREKYIKKYVKLYQKAYAKGIISQSELSDYLDKLNLSAIEKEIAMHEAEIMKTEYMIDQYEKSEVGGGSSGAG